MTVLSFLRRDNYCEQFYAEQCINVSKYLMHYPDFQKVKKTASVKKRGPGEEAKAYNGEKSVSRGAFAIVGPVCTFTNLGE